MAQWSNFFLIVKSAQQNLVCYQASNLTCTYFVHRLDIHNSPPEKLHTFVSEETTTYKQTNKESTVYKQSGTVDDLSSFEQKDWDLTAAAPRE